MVHGVATLVERKLGPQLALADALPIQCVTTGVAFILLAASTGQAAPPQAVDFWLAIAWVVGLSTLGGYGFYWFNLRLGSVTRVSSLIYLTPPVTMVWAYGMFGDTIGADGLLGLVICLIAVMLVRYSRTIQPNAPFNLIASIRTYVQTWRARQHMRELLAYDDQLLGDLGYCRSDLIWALRLPPTRNIIQALRDSHPRNARR